MAFPKIPTRESATAVKMQVITATGAVKERKGVRVPVDSSDATEEQQVLFRRMVNQRAGKDILNEETGELLPEGGTGS